MIIFGSILTTYESSSIFGGSWGSIENCLKPKIEPPLGKLACPNPSFTDFLESGNNTIKGIFYLKRSKFSIGV